MRTEITLRPLRIEDATQMTEVHIHPQHAASQHVAMNLGMVPTPVEVDGEIQWAKRLTPERKLDR